MSFSKKLKFIFDFSGRIGRAEYIYKWLSYCLMINIFSIVLQFTDESYKKAFFLSMGILIWPLGISFIKTRYNDLPSARFGILFWWWRCIFTKGDGQLNKYGPPARDFSLNKILGILAAYVILIITRNHLGLK